MSINLLTFSLYEDCTQHKHWPKEDKINYHTVRHAQHLF
jgi:hypothetical protein